MEDKQEKLEKVRKEVESCKRCPLHETRNNPVIGEGDPEGMVFIGEAPGYNEDQKGEPFVGRAGKVLDELLESVGLKREDVYITNIIKCRPPGNRDPNPEEIKACSYYLERQLAILEPKIIVPLGKFAMTFVFDKFGLGEEKISDVHGQVFKVSNLTGTFKIIPLYHPAAATYDPRMKSVLLEDFKKLKGIDIYVGNESKEV